MKKLINDLKHLVNPAAGPAKPWRRRINPVKNIKKQNEPKIEDGCPAHVFSRGQEARRWFAQNKPILLTLIGVI